LFLARRVGLLVVIAVAAQAVLAPGASAHALLLRTVPSPQTTVKAAPKLVKLAFSEPVEAAFGAIRVFDVDGHRVDAGRLARADGGREVDVPTPHIHDGTYTVTWRVVSADGHPVHGGFSFYVGAPSTISAVVVEGDHGAGRVVGLGFGVVRFTWFAALLALVGTAVARRWVWTPAVRAAGLEGSPAAAGFRRRSARVLRVAWAILLLAGAASLVFEAASVSGLSLVGSLRPAVWSGVMHTAYGHLWAASMALGLVLGLPALALAGRRQLAGVRPNGWLAVGAVLAVGLCAAVALNGHARTLAHPFVGVPSVALHLMGVAVWVGGLGALVVLGGLGWRSLEPALRPALLGQLVPRFGRLAVVAAGVVLATGALNTVLGLALVSDLWRLPYGRIVLAKIALVIVALALAARHRFVAPARLASPSTAGREAGAFARSASVEFALLAAAVALAAGLVTLVPGRSLALAANGPVNLEQRVGPDTVQLFLDPSAVGANQVHLTYVTGQGLSDAAIARAGAALSTGTAPPVPVPLRLISPGHFVGDATLAAAGPYRLVVDPTGGLPGATFSFRLGAAGGWRPASALR